MKKSVRTVFVDNCMICNFCLTYFYHKTNRFAEKFKKRIFLIFDIFDTLNEIFCRNWIDEDFHNLPLFLKVNWPDNMVILGNEISVTAILILLLCFTLFMKKEAFKVFIRLGD